MLGDLVTATALINPLLTAFPGAQVWMLCRPHIVDTLSANPALAGAIGDPMGYSDTPQSPSYHQLRQTLAKHQFDAVIHCWENPRYAQLTHELGIPIRVGHAIGFGNRRHNTHTVSLDYRDYHRHKVEMNAALLTPFGIRTPDLRLNLTLPDAMTHTTIQRMGLSPLGYRVMHTDAGAPSKCLVDSEWRPILTGILDQDPLPLVLIGSHLANTSPDTVQWIDQHPQVINLVGKTPLIDSVAIIRHAYSFIGPDSGLSHVAAAYQIPSLVFYRNRTQNVFHWGPWRCPHIVIKQQHNCKDNCHPLTCQIQCNRHPLDTQAVVDAVSALTNQATPPSHWSNGTLSGQHTYWHHIGHQVAAPVADVPAAIKMFPGTPIVPLLSPRITDIKATLVAHNINLIVASRPTWQLKLARTWASNYIHFYPKIIAGD